MDPTTLVTFLFRAPPEARTVELLGSWDNFSQPYRMHHDRKRGEGLWSGCFEFHNIIFDGDRLSWRRPRTGGLKQGGTYWYYYRLDYEIEAYDDSKQCASNCPLLPGQTMNVIEVPMEIEDRPNRSRSASVDLVGTLMSLPSMHTLNPGDKFAALDPPPISKVHLRCRSDLELNGRLENTISALEGPSSGEPEFTERDQLQHHFADDCSAERIGSIHSSRSWYSAASTSAHSSILNGHDGGPLLLRKPRSMPSRSRDPIEPTILDSSTEVPDLSKLQFRVEPDISEDEDESDAVAHNQSQKETSADIDARSEFEDGCSGYHTQVSSHNIRIHVSRPCSSQSEQEERSRYSSRLDSSRQCASSSAVRPPSRDPPAPPNLTQPSEDETTHQPDSHDFEEDEDDDSAGIWSPTFSAATVSSTGGVNTPYRLSATHTTTLTANPSSDSIESVAERLRSLSAIDYDTSLPPTILEEGDEPVLQPFAGYTIPSEEAMRSTQSLDKLSSGSASLLSTIPTIMMPGAEEDSFADSIFSELTYLGAAVA